MRVTVAEYAGGLSLKLTFDDGTTRIVDFFSFIRNHPHPQYDKYLDQDTFRTFRLENGNVVWGEDWDMIFPVEDLYNGYLY